MARIKMKEFASRVSANTKEDIGIGDTKKFIRAVFEEMTKEDSNAVLGTIAEYKRKLDAKTASPVRKTTKKKKAA